MPATARWVQFTPTPTPQIRPSRNVSRIGGAALSWPTHGRIVAHVGVLCRRSRRRRTGEGHGAVVAKGAHLHEGKSAPALESVARLLLATRLEQDHAVRRHVG